MSPDVTLHLTDFRETQCDLTESPEEDKKEKLMQPNSKFHFFSPR